MARRRPPIWLLLAAAAYLAYFALLIYCHAHRPAGVAAGGGTRAARDAYTLTLPLAAATFEPRRDVVLYGFRGVQLVTLVLAITVAFKRPRDPIALTGAWLLATAGVFSVALPAGWASGWRLLPAAVTWPMWLPFLSTLAAGGILFLFAALSTGLAIGVYGFTISFAGTTLFCVAAFLLHLSPFRAFVQHHRLYFTLDHAQQLSEVIAILQQYCDEYRQLSIQLNRENMMRYEYALSLKRSRSADLLLEELKRVQGIRQLKVSVNEMVNPQ